MSKDAGFGENEASDPEVFFATMSELLQPEGWKLELEKSSTTFSIRMSHDLSTTRGISLFLDHPASDSWEFVEQQILSAPERLVVARRPQDMPHRQLIQSLRQTAQANFWTHNILVMIALVLRRHGVLTQEEAGWLGYAGVPWDKDTDPDAGPFGEPLGEEPVPQQIARRPVEEESLPLTKRMSKGEYLQRIEELANEVCEKAEQEGWLSYLPEPSEVTPFQRSVNELARSLRRIHHAEDGCYPEEE